MPFDTKLNLNDNKIEQSSGDTFTFLGVNEFNGSMLVNSGATVTGFTEVISFACSDETTDLIVSSGITTIRIPYNLRLYSLFATSTIAPSGSSLIVDVNKNGSTILSTKISIDSGEKTSLDASTQPVISDNVVLLDDEITVDIDQIGFVIAGTGLKIYLIGYLI